MTKTNFLQDLNLKNYTIQDQLQFAWKTKKVWWYTATSRTQARFTRTKLGSFWLGLTNLLTVAALGSVYGVVFEVSDLKNYVVYLGLGIVFWNTLSIAIATAPALFERNRENINNIHLPPLFYVLEEWAFHLQTLAQATVIVIIGLSLFQWNLLVNLCFSAIPHLINFVIFMFWLPLLVCIIGARFKDFYQLVPILLQLIFLLSPILYTKNNLGEFGWLAKINIFYQSFSHLRDSLISGETQWMMFLA